MNTKLVRIRPSDLNHLRKECKNLFLEYHPEFNGEKLEDSFMLKKVIDYYLE